MPVFYLKYDYRGWGNTYHLVEAATKTEAIRKFIRGTHVPEKRVHVWKGRGLPKVLAGRKG